MLDLLRAVCVSVFLSAREAEERKGKNGNVRSN